MKNITYMILSQAIKDKETIDMFPFGPTENGLFALYIGILDNSPSGFSHPRPLITTDFVYKTESEAVDFGKKLLQELENV